MCYYKINTEVFFINASRTGNVLHKKLIQLHANQLWSTKDRIRLSVNVILEETTKLINGTTRACI